MKASTKAIRLLETPAPSGPKAKEKQRLDFKLWRSSADCQWFHTSTCLTPSFGQKPAIDCSLQPKERSFHLPLPGCSKKGPPYLDGPRNKALVTNPLSIADNGGANWALADNIQGNCWRRGEFTQRHCNFVVCVMRASTKAIRFLETLSDQGDSLEHTLLSGPGKRSGRAFIISTRAANDSHPFSVWLDQKHDGIYRQEHRPPPGLPVDNLDSVIEANPGASQGIGQSLNWLQAQAWRAVSRGGSTLTSAEKISGFPARFAQVGVIAALTGNLITNQLPIYGETVCFQRLLSHFVCHSLPRVTLRVSN